MAPRLPHHHRYSLDHWLRRLDRAAARMNPYLTVLVIGLIVLNLTCVALLATQLPITHGDPLTNRPAPFDRPSGVPPR